jgi:hypothetical protein
MPLLRSGVIAAILALAACAPRTQPQLLSPSLDSSGEPAPSGAPSAVPLPLPAYPYEPGFWV